jgi:Predicted N-acetylglucosaminyl transferase
MYNDDLWEEFKDIHQLLASFNKLKNGEPHELIQEDDFEYIIDYFEDNGDRENTLLACELATSLYPFSTLLLIRKVECLTSQKKYGQALNLLDKVDELDPLNIEALFMRSDILLEQNKFSDAIELLNSRVDLFERTDKIDILIELSEVYDEVEEFDMVYQTLKRILHYDPNNEDALMRICFWAEITQQHEDSIAFHQTLTDEAPYNAMIWYNLGVAYQALKLYEKAIDSYEYCLAIDDKFEYAYRNMGDAYIKLKEYKKAIEVLETHLNIAKPEDVILDAIGYCWEKQKDYSKARSYYRKASQLNPQDDHMFFKIGETYTKELQWEKAIKAYSHALHINKNNASYCMALGNCLMEMNAETEALKCYVNAVQLRPDIKSTWQSLVKAMYKSGHLEEALSQITIAQEHCGFKAEFTYYRAAVLLALGKAKEALIELENALAENPKKQNALNYIDKEIACHPLFAEVLIRYKKRS